MQLLQFAVFITIILVIQFSINYYLYKSGKVIFGLTKKTKAAYKLVMYFFMIAFPVGKLIERSTNFGFYSLFLVPGAFWIAAMSFLLLFTISGKALEYLFLKDTRNIVKVRQKYAICTIFCVIAILIYGNYNYNNTQLTKINLNIKNQNSKISKLNVIFISDIHLGTLIGFNKFSKVVNQINSAKPDIILIGGDLVDDRIEPLKVENIDQLLKKLSSKYGTYYINGNHDLMADNEEILEYLQRDNIKTLVDSSILVDSSFYLIGRNDKSIVRYGKTRKNLDQITKACPLNLPKILLDHQPSNLEDAQNNNIDLQLSGHTHHGQFFPANIITSMIYKISWGYNKIGKTNYYVSCGVFGWGPAVRIGSHSEIVNLIINFK